MQNPFKKVLEAKQLEFGSMQYICMFRDDAGTEEAAWVHDLNNPREDVEPDGWADSLHLLRLQQKESEQILLALRSLAVAVDNDNIADVQEAQKQMIDAIKSYGTPGIVDWLVGDIFMTGRFSVGK